MKQTKTGFVRNLPDDYSIDQVIAALDKAGFPKTSRENAFSLRHNAKKRKPKSNGHAATAPRAAAARSSSATTRAMTASDFIRTQPLTMDTGEVTKAAHAAGYSAVTRKYVGSVRWRYREPDAPAPAQADAAPAAQETVPIAAPPQPPPLPSPPPPMPAPVPEPEPLPATVTVRRSNAEWRRLFVECVCELGTTRSALLLDQVEELIASATLEVTDQ